MRFMKKTLKDYTFGDMVVAAIFGTLIGLIPVVVPLGVIGLKESKRESKKKAN